MKKLALNPNPKRKYYNFVGFIVNIGIKMSIDYDIITYSCVFVAELLWWLFFAFIGVSTWMKVSWLECFLLLAKDIIIWVGEKALNKEEINNTNIVKRAVWD